MAVVVHAQDRGKMNDNEHENHHSVTENGIEHDLAGYRLEGGDWRDIEDGAPYPAEDEWKNIDLVTVNLAPDSDEGFYRSGVIFDGFDDLYGIEDFVDEIADAYGFTPA
jgi:hypothetical protein